MKCLNTPLTPTTGPPVVLMIQLHKVVETQPTPYIKHLLTQFEISLWSNLIVKVFRLIITLSRIYENVRLLIELFNKQNYNAEHVKNNKFTFRQTFTLNSYFSQYLFLFQVHRKSCQCLPIDIPNLFLTQQFYNSCKMKMEPLYFTTFTHHCL